MSFLSFFESLVRTPATLSSSLWIPDAPAAGPATQGEPGGYFEVRLSEMFLTDARQLFNRITPATFFLADYKYAARDVSQPFFVSNQLLEGLPKQAKLEKVHVRFVDTRVVGLTPYAGGDVSLFVGLFQTVIEDQRKALFSVFETLFGSFDLGVLSTYLKIADKLTSAITACLGAKDVECLLAERRVIGKNALPSSGYMVYLHSSRGKVDTADLVVQDGYLHRKVGAGVALVEDLDFCLVRIDRHLTRNDYMDMNFHATWVEARKKMVARQVSEAQALMLECSHQILESPDLTEDNKIGLIEYYQAKLMAAQSLLANLGAAAPATRAGGTDMLRQMQLRTRQSLEVDADELAEHFEAIARLTSDYAGAPVGNDAALKDELLRHLKGRQRAAGANAAELVRALATGSVST